MEGNEGHDVCVRNGPAPRRSCRRGAHLPGQPRTRIPSGSPATVGLCIKPLSHSATVCLGTVRCTGSGTVARTRAGGLTDGMCRWASTSKSVACSSRLRMAAVRRCARLAESAHAWPPVQCGREGRMCVDAVVGAAELSTALVRAAPQRTVGRSGPERPSLGCALCFAFRSRCTPTRKASRRATRA